METNKLLWSSDSPFTNTGYSSQSLFLLNGLAKKGWECHYQAHNYPGQNLGPKQVRLNDGVTFDFHLYGGGKEGFSKDLLIPRIRTIKPDYFITLLDTFMCYPWYLQMDFAPAKTGFWFPSDGGKMPLGCENVLKKMNLPVAMAKYGQRQCWDYYKIKTEQIPHGVDANKFYPLNKDDIKAKYGLQGKFVVGVVARNQGRKMLDRTIKAFKLFSLKTPNSVLLLHSDPLDAAAVFDMNNLVAHYGLQNRVRYTGVTYHAGFTYEQMNEVYNCMDVFFLSTSGEGFGVPIIEAMSCGVPVVATDYTTTPELLLEGLQCGEGVKLAGCDDISQKDYLGKYPEYDEAVGNGTITGSWSVERGLMDIKDGSDKLQKLYDNIKLRETYSKRGREKVLKTYDWPIIINQWDKLLRSRL